MTEKIVSKVGNQEAYSNNYDIVFGGCRNNAPKEKTTNVCKRVHILLTDIIIMVLMFMLFLNQHEFALLWYVALVGFALSISSLIVGMYSGE